MGSLDKLDSKEAYKPMEMGEKESPEEDDSAAADVLAAIKANDAKALGLALSRHYEECAESAGEEA